MNNFNKNLRQAAARVAVVVSGLGGVAAGCSAAPAPKITPAHLLSHAPEFVKSRTTVEDGELAKRVSNGRCLVDGSLSKGDSFYEISASYATNNCKLASSSNLVAADTKRYVDMPGTKSDFTEQGAMRYLGNNTWRIYEKAGDFNKYNAASTYPTGKYTECGKTATTCNQAYMADFDNVLEDLKVIR